MTAVRWRHGTGSRLDELGDLLGVDAGKVVGERAELMGLSPAGRISWGGACRLLRAADDWIAVSLARPDDWEVVPAWLGLDGVAEGKWGVVEDEVARTAASGLVEMATLLGLPVARVGERSAGLMPTLGRATSLDGVHVVDLSSLWAGPLAGRLLADGGAEVVKVESATRPDGARAGHPEFFERLNGAKRSVMFDFEAERERLHEVVADADVVITSARARALEGLGLQGVIDVDRQVWLAISGYGLTGPDAVRVAFGDDAAAAGGLVDWADDVPLFAGDALADPLSGLVGAAAVFAALASGRGASIDLAMADVAAWMASDR